MNSLSRYYVPPKDWNDHQISILGDEAHHAVRVLRVKLGGRLEVFDGKGRFAEAEIVSVSKSCVSVKVLQSLHQEPPATRIELCQAIPKAGNMELIVQKAVELGVASIQPLVTEHTVARAEQLEKKRAKWQRIALEACKQCGQNYLPEVAPILTFSQWIEQRRQVDHEIVAALHPSSRPIRQVISGQISEARRIRLWIGPEGDFSTAEYEQMLEQEMSFMSIGKIVLRVETATLFCLSALNYELGL